MPFVEAQGSKCRVLHPSQLLARVGLLLLLLLCLCCNLLSTMLRRFAVVLCLSLACSLIAQTTPPPAATGKPAKTKKSKPGRVVATVFSEDVANQLLAQIRDGLQGHNPRRMLATFDRDHMDGYFSLEDRTYAYFNRYDSFRAFFHVLQSSTEKDRGVALAEWQIEASPASGPPERREGQVRFEFAAGKDGWQIVDFTPRDFFQ